ncbi:MAG: serine/threonine-protein kinase [Planctomycetota bacterium]|nr:serine/threonine-protein kinase [Planctomycetota bacterium]
MTDQPTPDKLGAEHLREAAKQPEDLDSLRARVQAHLPAYELKGCLGRGGMGVVFLAHQSRLDRQVAIKVLLPPPRPIDGWEERFLREAKALAKLTHPGIVAVYDFDQQEDLAWIVMEFVDGSNLRQLMEAERLDPSEALAIVPQVCAALQYAHDQGIVHRDIKPENILMDETGAVKIADFGLAKLMDTETVARLTASDQAMGTLRYMAPEQFTSPMKVDHRADIFSLGVVLYEMLTGTVPQGVVRPPSEKVQVDVRLDEVVLKSMQEEPERRYQRVGDVKSSLEEISSTNAPTGGASQRPVAITTEASSRSGGSATIIAKLGDVFAPIAAGFAYTGLVGSVGGDNDSLTVLPELALIGFFLSLWLLLWAPLVGCLTGRIQSGSPGLSAVRLVSGAINFLALACWGIMTFTTEGTWDSPEAYARFIQEQQITIAFFGFCLICCGTQAVSGAIGLVASWDIRSASSLSPAVRSRLENAVVWMSIPGLAIATMWANFAPHQAWIGATIYGALALTILLVGWNSSRKGISTGGALSIVMLALAGVGVALSFGQNLAWGIWAIAVALPLIQALLAGVLAVSHAEPEGGSAE